MPAKPKFTKEQLVDAAYELLREGGEDCISAREVGKRVNSSSSPVFTLFENMEELRYLVWKKAIGEFNSRIALSQAFRPAYKKMGMEIVRFAIEEPHLFRYLLLSDNSNNEKRAGAAALKTQSLTCAIANIMSTYELNPECAEFLFNQMYVFTLGLATMFANKVITYDETAVCDILGHAFDATLMLVRSGQYKTATIVPQKIE